MPTIAESDLIDLLTEMVAQEAANPPGNDSFSTTSTAWATPG
jgi:hypothetical protein